MHQSKSDCAQSPITAGQILRGTGMERLPTPGPPPSFYHART